MLRRLTLTLAALVMLLVPAPAAAADGGGYALPGGSSSWDGYAVAGQICQTYRSTYDPGKTAEGFRARATDGCHVYEWTGSIAQGPASGTVTFTTTNKVDPWAGDLPNPGGGVHGYNQMRAAHEANLQWIYRFQTGPGVRVTVTYEAD